MRTHWTRVAVCCVAAVLWSVASTDAMAKGKGAEARGPQEARAAVTRCGDTRPRRERTSSRIAPPTVMVPSRTTGATRGTRIRIRARKARSSSCYVLH